MKIIAETPQDIVQIISKGDYARAEEKLRDVLAQDTRIFDAWHLLGIVQLKTNRIEEAIASISHAISLSPRFPAAHSNLSACYLRKKEYAAAINWAREALKADPQFAQAWSNIARAHLLSNRIDESIIALKNGLKTAPDHAGLLNGMGLIYALKNQHAVAIRYYKKALNTLPLEAGTNLAASLTHLQRHEEALYHIERVLALSKNNPQALIIKGNIFYEMGRFQDVLDVYQFASSLYPDQSDIQTNMGILLLLLGDYPRGFTFFENRKKTEKFLSQEKLLNTPSWQGEDIAGKTLLVSCEQGYGDTIQFLRYIPFLKAYNCKVILSLQLELHCLFKDLGVILTCPQWETPEHDLHVYLMSLPYIFKTDLSHIPAPISIPHVRLRPIKNRIGITWKGNPQHGRNKNRSLDLKLFQPLFAVPETHYVSLQQDVTQEEAEFLSQHKVRRPHLQTFMDTLRILETCERVICIDSVIAHLAGSMGIPTAVLVSYTPDWRWLLERSDSVWYPNIRLFRQTLCDSWEEPINKVQRLDF